MEFHNAKLLPKGLHEIIANLVPYDIYPNTKVIVYRRKWIRGVAGIAGYDGMTQSYYIGLYPTVLSFYVGNGGIGTYSFNLWFSYLKTALHEIGHLATYALIQNIPCRIGSFGKSVRSMRDYIYVEKLADNWRDQALVRILQVSPRLGQLLGALTGYPGINAYRLRNWGKPFNNGKHNYYRQAEWRGLGCGGQITIGDIIHEFYYKWWGYNLDKNDRVKIEAQLRREIHRVAKIIGIDRFFINKNGRRYLMFNVREAEAIYQQLLSYKWQGNIFEAEKKPLKWEFLNGNWELIECEEREKIPIEQLTLPGFAHRKRRKAKEAQR